MMKAINPSKIASNVFQRATFYRFCINWAPADPRKHITMHHSANNMYRDLWDYGQYPDWVHLCSVPARTYEPQVVDIVAQTLNQKFVHLQKHREPIFLPISSTPSATDLGPSSSPRISKSIDLSTKFTRLFWANCPKASSSKRADSPGLSSRDTDSTTPSLPLT